MYKKNGLLLQMLTSLNDEETSIEVELIIGLANQDCLVYVNVCGMEIKSKYRLRTQKLIHI